MSSSKGAGVDAANDAGPSTPVQAQPAAVQPEVQSWWSTLCTFSVFAFPDPALERDFQRYLTDTTNVSTWSFCCEIIAAWFMFATKYYSFPQDHWFLPRAWAVGLAHPVSAAAFLCIMALAPSTYRRHQRVAKLALLLVIMLTVQPARGALLWMKSVDAKYGKAAPWFQQLQSFSVENVHIFGAVRNVHALPIGQIPDLLLSTAFLVWVMAGNTYICGLPHLGDSLVTMSPGLLSGTEVASVWLSGISGPAVSIHPGSRQLSCHTALGFWQVLGSVLGCVAIALGDILRRRAFLRTPAARARLGRGNETWALGWPFENQALFEKGVAVGFCLVCLWGSVVWNTALNFWILRGAENYVQSQVLDQLIP